MVDISRAFSVQNGLSFDDAFGIFSGLDDPTSDYVGNATDVPVGSIYISNGLPIGIYQRIDDTETPSVDWILLGASATTDLASVVVRRLTSLAIPTSWVDIDWDITDVENDSSIIEHSATIDRIVVKETGLYAVAFSISIDADVGEESFDLRVRLNDTTVLSASERTISEDDEINDVSNYFTVELTAGDFLSLQIQASGAGNILTTTTNFVVVRLRGAKGDQGIPGSGSSIAVQDSGINIANTPHTTLNFTGALTAADGGSGVANISNLFGAEFQYAEAAQNVFVTTSTAFQNVLDWTTASLPAGTYMIQWSYGWSYDATDSNFVARIVLDDVDTTENDYLMYHQQEPSDSAGTPVGKWSTAGTGTDQIFRSSGFEIVTFGSVSTHHIELDIRASTAGVESAIWDINVTLWRVG